MTEADLHAERHRLLDKKFAGTATNADATKLAVVRAALDEIEMARMAPDFARLEAVVANYEEIAKGLDEVWEWLESL